MWNKGTLITRAFTLIGRFFFQNFFLKKQISHIIIHSKYFYVSDWLKFPGFDFS